MIIDRFPVSIISLRWRYGNWKALGFFLSYFIAWLTIRDLCDQNVLSMHVSYWVFSFSFKTRFALTFKMCQADAEHDGEEGAELDETY